MSLEPTRESHDTNLPRTRFFSLSTVDLVWSRLSNSRPRWRLKKGVVVMFIIIYLYIFQPCCSSVKQYRQLISVTRPCCLPPTLNSESVTRFHPGPEHKTDYFCERCQRSISQPMMLQRSDLSFWISLGAICRYCSAGGGSRTIELLSAILIVITSTPRRTMSDCIVV